MVMPEKRKIYKRKQSLKNEINNTAISVKAYSSNNESKEYEIKNYTKNFPINNNNSVGNENTPTIHGGSRRNSEEKKNRDKIEGNRVNNTFISVNKYESLTLTGDSNKQSENFSRNESSSSSCSTNSNSNSSSSRRNSKEMIDNVNPNSPHHNKSLEKNNEKGEIRNSGQRNNGENILDVISHYEKSTTLKINTLENNQKISSQENNNDIISHRKVNGLNNQSYDIQKNILELESFNPSSRNTNTNNINSNNNNVLDNMYRLNNTISTFEKDKKKPSEFNNKKYINPKTKSINSIPIFSGFLYKLGRNKRWQWRMFCFDGVFLACLSNKNVPKYVIPMSNVESIRLLHKNSPEYKPNTFVITVNRTYPSLQENSPMLSNDFQGSSVHSNTNTTNNMNSPGNSNNNSNNNSSHNDNYGNMSPTKSYENNLSRPKRVSSNSKSIKYFLRAKTTVDLERWMFVLLTMYKVVKNENANNHFNNNINSPIPTSTPTPSTPTNITNNYNSPNPNNYSPAIDSPKKSTFSPLTSPIPPTPTSSSSSPIRKNNSSTSLSSMSNNSPPPSPPLVGNRENRNNIQNNSSPLIHNSTYSNGNDNNYIPNDQGNITLSSTKSNSLDKIKIPSLTFTPSLSTMISSYCKKEKVDVLSAQRYRDPNYKPGYTTELNSLTNINDRKDYKRTKDKYTKPSRTSPTEETKMERYGRRNDGRDGLENNKSNNLIKKSNTTDGVIRHPKDIISSNPYISSSVVNSQGNGNKENINSNAINNNTNKNNTTNLFRNKSANSINNNSPLIANNKLTNYNSNKVNTSNNNSQSMSKNILFNKSSMYERSKILASPQFKHNNSNIPKIINNPVISPLNSIHNKTMTNFNKNTSNNNTNSIIQNPYMSAILEDFIFGNYDKSQEFDDSLQEYAFQSLRLFSLAEQKAAAENVAAAWNLGRDNDEVLDVLVQELRKTPILIENGRSSIVSQQGLIVDGSEANESFQRTSFNAQPTNGGNRTNTTISGNEDNTFISFAIDMGEDEEDTSSNSTKDDDDDKYDLPSIKNIKKGKEIKRNLNDIGNINYDPSGVSKDYYNQNPGNQSTLSSINDMEWNDPQKERFSRHVRFNMNSNTTKYIQKAWRTSVVELLNLDNEMNISLEPSNYCATLNRKHGQLVERSSSLPKNLRTKETFTVSQKTSSEIPLGKNTTTTNDPLNFSDQIHPRMVNNTNIASSKHYKARMMPIMEKIEENPLGEEVSDEDSDDDDDDDESEEEEEDLPIRKDSIATDKSEINSRIRKNVVNQIRIPKGRPYSYYLAQNQNRGIVF